MIILSNPMDYIDEVVARLAFRVTKFGNYLDVMCDKYREFIFYLGFTFIGYAFEAFLRYQVHF